VELTNDDVQDILHILDSLPFGELSLQTARFRLSLRRTGNGEWTQSLEVLDTPRELAPDAAATGRTALDAAGPEPAEPEPAEPEPAEPEPAEPEPAEPEPAEPEPAELAPSAQENPDGSALTEVRAPLLGTFYRAPRPGAPPFVTVGSVVGPDTVVCIIETMKLMNSVTAGVTGTVAEILLANAQFAAQGRVLMRIRADG
jgi:acetyl-CoA carboxylase biotin carboxyl carrier protein